jgi:hypothetical protein
MEGSVTQGPPLTFLSLSSWSSEWLFPRGPFPQILYLFFIFSVSALHLHIITNVVVKWVCSMLLWKLTTLTTLKPYEAPRMGLLSSYGGVQVRMNSIHSQTLVTHRHIYERMGRRHVLVACKAVDLRWVHTCYVTAYRNTVSWQCGRDSWPRNVSKVGYAVTLWACTLCCRYLAVASKGWYGYGLSMSGRTTCYVTTVRCSRLLYIRDASGSRNKLGTPCCNSRRIRHEARDESSDRYSVSCESLATLRRYGTH